MSTRKLAARRARVAPVIARRTLRRWKTAEYADTAAYLHWMYATHRKKYLAAYVGKSSAYSYPDTVLGRAWRWYVGDVLIQAFKLWRVNGAFVRDTARVRIWRQGVDMLRLALRLPSMPENYYKFELYRPANRARASEYLHRHETKSALFKMLTAVKSLDEASPLTDKLRFVEHAERAGVSAAPIVAVLAEGKITQRADELPRADLFVKPQAGKGGRGAQVWAYDAATDQYTLLNGSRSVGRGEFLDLLEAQAIESLIVQPRLVNHPDVADLALAAVPTCRLITFTNEVGAGEPVIAVFRMPSVPGRVVDNIHAGGIAAPIDLDSGRLGPATRLGVTPTGRYEAHPQTGVQITGRVLPHWEDVLKLGTRAHESFAPRVIAGWDIAICPDGPTLVEGNARPCVDLLQRPHDLPLGSHRFGELMAFHLRRRYTAGG